MTYDEALGYIHSLGNFTAEAGLERIKKVMEMLGDPQNGFRSIHIAGTNGKGSVSAMLAEIFKIAGYKTGLFISPYIVDFRERIQINGEYISQEELCLYAERIINTGVFLTEFEFITALAFLYFNERNIDILICETGLGGRFDATNVLDKLMAAVITKIGLDHTALLGDSIEKIAFEKCGILRDCPTITSPYQPKEAMRVIEKSSNRLFTPDTDKLKVLSSDITGSRFIYKNAEYRISLCGDYQIENALTVITVLEAIDCGISYDIIYKALSETFFPARMEVISAPQVIILDGAHNPDGADVLSREMARYSGSITAIIGMMKDKDYNKVLAKTLCHCKNAIAVSVPDMPRSIPARELCRAAESFCECSAAENLSAAIETAVKVSNGEPIFIFGSLYLASAIRPMLKEKFK